MPCCCSHPCYTIGYFIWLSLSYINYLMDPTISAMDSFSIVQRFKRNSLQSSEIYLGSMNCFHIMAFHLPCSMVKLFRFQSFSLIYLPARKYHDAVITVTIIWPENKISPKLGTSFLWQTLSSTWVRYWDISLCALHFESLNVLQNIFWCSSLG